MRGSSNAATLAQADDRGYDEMSELWVAGVLHLLRGSLGFQGLLAELTDL